jgi:hypothetical protein
MIERLFRSPAKIRPPFDLSRLNEEELAALERIAERLAEGGSEDNS